MAGNHSLDDFLDAGDDAESETASGTSGPPAATQPADAVDGGDAEADGVDGADAEADAVDGGDAEADGVDGAEGVDVADAVDDGDDDQAVESTGPVAVTETADPAEITYDWSPDGAACDACGEAVERRWRAGEGAADPAAMVCGDCKDW